MIHFPSRKMPFVADHYQEATLLIEAQCAAAMLMQGFN